MTARILRSIRTIEGADDQGSAAKSHEIQVARNPGTRNNKSLDINRAPRGRNQSRVEPEEPQRRECSIRIRLFRGATTDRHCCRGVAEHPSVIGMYSFLPYIRRSGAWFAFPWETRTAPSKAGPTFAKTVRRAL